MVSDVLRVYMMHPEWADNRRAKHGGFEFTPSISSPVYDSRDEINQKLGDDETEKGREGSLAILNSSSN
jgi:hypothetical protein